jgi:hypothetical protein
MSRGKELVDQTEMPRNQGRRRDPQMTQISPISIQEKSALSAKSADPGFQKSGHDHG